MHDTEGESQQPAVSVYTRHCDDCGSDNGWHLEHADCPLPWTAGRCFYCGGQNVRWKPTRRYPP